LIKIKTALKIYKSNRFVVAFQQLYAANSFRLSHKTKLHHRTATDLAGLPMLSAAFVREPLRCSLSSSKKAPSLF